MQEGLSTQEARKRLKIHGPNLIRPRKKSGVFYLFFSQIKNPLTLLLLFAALLAFFLRDFTDGYIVLAIVSISALLGFYQEKKSCDAVFKLTQMVSVFADVIRDGEKKIIHIEKVVPGDLVIVAAGDMIPADGTIVECKDFFVDEAQLTGESLPVEKVKGSVFMGSHVSSGMAKILIEKTGKSTKFAAIAEHLKLRPPETSFEQGIRRFGYFLMRVTIILIALIFAFNIFFERPFLESLLFSLALAVGLTPQLLPAIITVNLSKGARLMAKEKVIVRHLSAIENFGAMNILCIDKTGTITQGKIQLTRAVDTNNETSEEVLLFGYMNAFFQTGYSNPLDLALTSSFHLPTKDWEKLDEIPYDFVRKRLSVLVQHHGKKVIVTKGAVKQVLQICKHSEKDFPFIEQYALQGFRVLAVAQKETKNALMSREDEKEMKLMGFLVMADPLKEGIERVLEEIKEQGIEIKIVTGDNRYVARYTCEKVGLDSSHLITGEELSKISQQALRIRAKKCSIFAEIEPNQKERIMLALRQSGNVVGFLGDGVNDVTAIHSADVGISVDSAVDVAKETADFVLLRKDLSVLKNGIIEGRKTFMNTLKYIFMASSANFGNMFSMAGASLFLSFLPLLPKQILLTNLLTDFPEMTIATDRVDLETIKKPLKWNLPFIRNFMILFGLISSIFDYSTFGVLLYFLHASVSEFRTGWFLESVASAAMIVLVIRTQRRFFQSAPSFLLGFLVIGIVFFTMWIPYTILAVPFEFVPLPMIFYGAIGIILILYIALVEIAKGWFYKKFHL